MSENSVLDPLYNVFFDFLGTNYTLGDPLPTNSREPSFQATGFKRFKISRSQSSYKTTLLHSPKLKSDVFYLKENTFKISTKPIFMRTFWYLKMS